MAFNPSATAQNTVATADDKWKAQGFLNLYLPGADGQPIKLGAIPLRANDADQRKLITWLTEDPSRVVKLLSKMTASFNSAERKATAGFALD